MSIDNINVTRCVTNMNGDITDITGDATNVPRGVTNIAGLCSRSWNWANDIDDFLGNRCHTRLILPDMSIKWILVVYILRYYD